MRKNLVVGILSESKNEWEKRAPLTPQDAAWLIQRQIQVEVAPSTLRAYKDSEYQKAGAVILLYKTIFTPQVADRRNFYGKDPNIT